jgi:hypothetical protein
MLDDQIFVDQMLDYQIFVDQMYVSNGWWIKWFVDQMVCQSNGLSIKWFVGQIFVD